MKSKSLLTTAAAIATAGLLVANPAMAADIGEVASDIAGKFGGVMELVKVVIYIVGFCLLAYGIMLFWERSKDEGRTPLSKPLTAICVGGSLIAIMWVINVSTDTLGADEVLDAP